MRTILDCIPPSPDRVSRDELSRMFDVPVREIQRCVTNARLDGEIIGSDERGYFIPQKPQEMAAFYRTHRARAMTTLKSLKAVRRALQAAGVDVRKIEGRK